MVALKRLTLVFKLEEKPEQVQQTCSNFCAGIDEKDALGEDRGQKRRSVNFCRRQS